MIKHRESSADRLWKEKLDECASSEAAVVLLFLAIAVVAALLIANWQ